MIEDKFFSKNYYTFLLLTTYPVTLLFTVNYHKTSFMMYLIPLTIVYLVFSFIYFLFYFLRNKYSLANYSLSANIVCVFLFIYGIFHSYFSTKENFLHVFGSHRFLIPAYIFILFAFVLFIKKLKRSSKAYKFIMIFLISLNTLPFLSIFNLKGKEEVADISIKNKVLCENLPNIYYIILDGYGSDYSLKNFLNYDNSNFTVNLNKIGFKVQENASSNYCRTIFSLSSTLNLNYIHEVIKTDVNQEKLNKYLSENLVSNFLKSHGYTYYLFDSGYGLKKKYADNEMLIKTNELDFLQNLFTTSDNDVLNSFLNNSIFMISNNSFLESLSIKNYASKVLNVYYKLPQIAKYKNKKFVFAHVISPHPPYLFDKTGNVGMFGEDIPASNWKTKPYIEQLQFINTKTIDLVNKIIKNDKDDKIIIIQGDHGSRTLKQTKKVDRNQNWVDEQYSILNAIYISKEDKSKEKVYENWNHSSVNTFRLIFNVYYGEKFMLLGDNKYYSGLNEPYSFELIKN